MLSTCAGSSVLRLVHESDRPASRMCTCNEKFADFAGKQATGFMVVLPASLGFDLN